MEGAGAPEKLGIRRGRVSRISELPDLIGRLPSDARRRADALLEVATSQGRTDPPTELIPWLEQQFGPVDAVREQQVIRVTARWSGEGTLFSPLRSRRPIAGASHEAYDRLVGATVGDEFCHPETGTPADTWGRIQGRRSITAANAAKYDALHGVVIFDHHDPLGFDPESVADMLDVGRAWAERGHALDATATNYLLIWNCGPRAGGSIVHGHAQVLLGRGRHYARVELLRHDAQAYRTATGDGLLTDLVAAHRDLGLSFWQADGVAGFASLTPIKERELWIVGRGGMDERDPAFSMAVTRTVIAYRDALGVRAFNLVLQRPPLDPEQAARGGWEELGPVVRIVDRGDPDGRSSDIGAMELYAASVVGADPFVVAEEMRSAMASGAIG
jgi:hypothetical protein